MWISCQVKTMLSFAATCSCPVPTLLQWHWQPPNRSPQRPKSGAQITQTPIVVLREPYRDGRALLVLCFPSHGGPPTTAQICLMTPTAILPKMSGVNRPVRRPLLSG
ncbi:hypothetical protein C2E23DRAFT_562173 [Lenzites betulinus]|nr:hypothetical protein C2E23DRAFT_562173 [Lenzites betulinus]